MSLFVTYSKTDGVYNLTLAGFTALVIIMIAILLAGCAVFGKNKRIGAKQLVFSAMAIALATVTSFIKLFSLPMGGSVTLLSMLFIVLIGYWYGVGPGLTAAVAYGILQLVTNPYIVSLPQMLVDYIFAFGALGLAGVFANKKYGLVKGYIVAVIGRFFFAVLSGVVFFAAYAPVTIGNKTIDALIYSVTYNGSYLAAEGIITIIVISIPPVKKALDYVKQMANSR